jgi:integrase
MKATLQYILRTDRPRPDGSALIYLRLTINRNNKLMLSTYRSIPLKAKFKHLTLEEVESFPCRANELESGKMLRDELYCWDKQKGRATRGFGSSESLNQFLNEELVRAENIIYDFAKRKKALTAEAFRSAFKKENVNKTFYDYCHEQLTTSRDNTLSDETIEGYLHVIRKLDRYKPGLRMEEIDFKFLNKYYNWMQKQKSEGGRGNVRSTANKNMKTIRTMILLAIKNGDFMEEHYPFKNFRIGETMSELTSRDFLEPEELMKLETILHNYTPPTSADYKRLTPAERKQRRDAGEITASEFETLRNFLFACYTGLRYRDMTLLDTQLHINGKWVENPYTFQRSFRYYIDLEAMHKTGKPLIVPLIDKAFKLLDINKSGLAFRVTSNQKTNKNLKRLAKYARINKVLSFHVARHTFATTCFTYGIPAEVGQKLLGHKSEKFIKVYTHLTQNRLFHEMDKVNKGFNEHEQLLRVVHKQDHPFISNATSLKLERLMELLSKMDDDKIDKIETIVKVVS